MKKLLFALGVALWLCAPAHAQVASAYTVSACGAQSNPAGQSFPLTMDLKGNLCGSISNTSAAPLYETPVVNGGPVTNANPIPVSASVTATPPANVTPTDCSGTITSGGTAQAAFAGASTIHGFVIANTDASAGSGEPLWFSMTTTAAASTAASYPLSAPTATTFAGLTSFTAPYGFGINHAVSVIAATTGHKFSCTYW
jgi:hypothetical protein